MPAGSLITTTALVVVTTATAVALGSLREQSASVRLLVLAFIAAGFVAVAVPIIAGAWIIERGQAHRVSGGTRLGWRRYRG